MAVRNQKDLRALADSFINGDTLVVGSEDVADRLHKRAWVESPTQYGSIDYAVYTAGLTDLGEEVLQRFSTLRGEIGYGEEYQMTPEEFLKAEFTLPEEFDG